MTLFTNVKQQLNSDTEKYESQKQKKKNHACECCLEPTSKD